MGLRSGSPGFLLAVFLGGCDSTVSDSSDAGLVSDGGPSSDAGVSALCRATPGGDGSDEGTFRFEHSGEGVVFLFTRYRVMYGPGESITFGIRMVTLDLGDGPDCATTEARIQYENSHHNFADRISITQGETRYDLMEIDWDEPSGLSSWTYTLTGIRTSDGAVVLGPVELEKTGGP